MLIQAFGSTAVRATGSALHNRAEKLREGLKSHRRTAELSLRAQVYEAVAAQNRVRGATHIPLQATVYRPQHHFDQAETEWLPGTRAPLARPRLAFA